MRGERGRDVGMPWVEVRDTATHPARHRTAPPENGQGRQIGTYLILQKDSRC